MVSAMPGLVAEARSRGWRLIRAAFDGCPVGYESLYDAHGTKSAFNCAMVRPAHDAVIAAMPNLVIWHDLQSVLSRHSPEGRLLVAGSDGWTKALVDEWETVLVRLTENGAEVVVILPPQRSQDILGCGRSVRPERCLEVQQQDRFIRAATGVFWARVRGMRGVHLIDVDPLVCPGSYPCPRLIDGIEVRASEWDQTHFTKAGAMWLAPRLLDEAMAAVAPPRANPIERRRD